MLVDATSLKGLITKLYKKIHLKVLETDSQLSSRVTWEEDVGELTDAQWNGGVTSVDFLSLLAAQKRTQLYIIHRAYYTPKRLSQFGKCPDASCPRCMAAVGDLIHMLWRCLKLYIYWEGVLSKINSVFERNLRMDPILCIFGYKLQNCGISVYTNRSPEVSIPG